MGRTLAAIVLLASAFAFATPARACVCYDSAGTEKTIDGTDACRAADACGNATATENATSPGICDCGTRSETINCSTVCTDNGYALAAPSATSATITPTVGYAIPQLNVKIPGVDFTTPVGKADATGSTVQSSTFIGTYVAGAYRYLLGFAMTIAIVLMMVGGLQYVLGASTGDVKSAKKRIQDAIEGLVLLTFIFVILYVTNPQLTVLGGLNIESIPPNPLAVKYVNDGEQAASCKDRTKIALTASDEKQMPSPYTSMTVPSASSCSGTKIPQGIRDEAFKTQQSTGVPAAVLLAQWAVESGYGEHCIGKHGNNCWGIKCTSGGTYAGNDTLVSSGARPTCPESCQAYQTTEVKGGVEDRYYSCFQDFPSLSDAMTKHAAVVKKKGWESYNGNPEAFAKFVQNNCYATATNYADAITGAMKKQCLY